jgi:hypothetical protein
LLSKVMRTGKKGYWLTMGRSRRYRINCSEFLLSASLS